MSACLAARCVALAVALALCAAAASVVAAQRSPERVRIEAERAAIEARWRAAEAECRTQFVVTACIDEAKSQRRAALAVQREAQLKLDDVERRERAAARLDELARKRAEAQSRKAPEVSVKASAPHATPRPILGPGKAHAPGASAASTAAASASASSSAPASAHATQAHRAALDGDTKAAALRAERAKQRRDEGEARRERIAQRAHSKASDAKKSAPLPNPASAPR